MKNDSRFVQLEIPGMEQFLIQNKTVLETTKMTLQTITDISTKNPDTALPAAMRYVLKAESDDRRGARIKLYCIIAGSAVIKSHSIN
ncbi:hypothetical protein [Nostoc sp.]|uniref:hypothetical protein n=1 Tax=Nostoc sp. TaxID=1180 RepID=UPI002FF5138C